MPQPMVQRITAKLTPHWNNLKYLARHKWYVLHAGLKLNVPLWRLIVHDWSKLTPIEWFAYTDYFFRHPERGGRMHKPGKNEVVMEGVLASADEPNLNDDMFPKEVLDKVVEDHSQPDEEFNRAWLHHIHLNKHHWQHWILSQDNGEVECLEMPAHFAREMTSDWIGAGKAQGKKDKTAVLVWYESNKENIKLHHRSRELVESLIKVYVHS